MKSPAELMSEGYSFTCSMCTKLWKTKTDTFDGCEARLLNQVCTGPMSGMSFPLYQGPLTDSARTDLCFRCGIESNYGLKMGIDNQIIGVCESHFKELTLYRQQSSVYKTLEDNRIRFSV